MRWFDLPIPIVLLSYAERAKDDSENVVDVGCAGDEVQGAESIVEVQQKHFMWRFLFGSQAGFGEA